MTTIIMGDVGEGAKWWSQAAFYKSELARMYKANNAFMQCWKFPSASVQIHVMMRAGQPVAFIYVTTGDYEFFTPTEMISIPDYEYTGVFFRGGVQVDSPIVLNPAKPALPVNTWYSEREWVTGGASVRYANPNSWGDDVFPKSMLDAPAKVFTSPYASSFTSPKPVNAAAKVGGYVYGISSTGEVFVWDATSGEEIYTKQLTLGDTQVAGYWSFNRAGNKACTVVWVDQWSRFNPGGTVPYVDLTSYVVEVEFALGRGNVFSSVNIIQTVETDDFTVAADYDWTTEGGELIMAQISLFDYRLYTGMNGTGVPLVVSGAAVKTNDMFLVPKPLIGGKRRGYTFWMAEYVAGGSGHLGDTPPAIADGIAFFTSGDAHLQQRPYGALLEIYRSAYDQRLNYMYLDGTVVKSVELMHNRDWSFDSTGARISEADYAAGVSTMNIRGSNSAYTSIVSGMDLRIQGATFYSTRYECAGNPQEGVRAEFYTDVYAGTSLPSSTDSVYTSNRYDAWLSVHRFRMENTPQTIAAVPYRKSYIDSFGEEKAYPIHQLSIYAPSYLFDPDRAVDFTYSDQGTTVAGYHKSTYQAKYSDPPLSSRYFISGAWATTKDRP